MRLSFLLVLFFLLNFSLQAQESNQSFIESGEILFESSPDLKQKYATQSDMQEVMLLDLSKEKTQRLTDDRSQDSSPTFFKEGAVLFSSKRPCENSMAENCPSQLFAVSKENKISKFKINFSDALQKAQQSPFAKELKKAGVDFEDLDYGIQYPSFNSNRNFLAVVLSAPHSFLVIYDLKNEKIVYFNRISGVSMNFHWSPNGNYLAFCYPVLKGITPTWVNTIIDVKTKEELTLSLSDDKLQFRNWSFNGKMLLLTKSHETGNGKRINDAYQYDWSTKKIEKINSKELPGIADWIQIVSDDQYLVQKVDQNKALDLWLINSAGDELKRLTNDGHLKSVSDTRIN